MKKKIRDYCNFVIARSTVSLKDNIKQQFLDSVLTDLYVCFDFILLVTHPRFTDDKTQVWRIY